MDFLVSSLLIDGGRHIAFDRDTSSYYSVQTPMLHDVRGKMRLSPNGKKVMLNKHDIKTITRSDYDKK